MDALLLGCSSFFVGAVILFTPFIGMVNVFLLVKSCKGVVCDRLVGL